GGRGKVMGATTGEVAGGTAGEVVGVGEGEGEGGVVGESEVVGDGDGEGAGDGDSDGEDAAADATASEIEGMADPIMAGQGGEVCREEVEPGLVPNGEAVPVVQVGQPGEDAVEGGCRVAAWVCRLWAKRRRSS